MAKKEKANGMTILNEQINKKEFSRVYLLGGTEPYLIYQYRDKLIAAMIEPADTMNFITYKGENSKPEDIIEFASTMPFFAERRVVLVENSNFFKNGCDNCPDLAIISATVSYIVSKYGFDNSAPTFAFCSFTDDTSFIAFVICPVLWTLSLRLFISLIEAISSHLSIYS